MSWSSHVQAEILECWTTSKATEKSNLIPNDKSINMGYSAIKKDRSHSLSSCILPDGISSMPGVYYNFMNSLVGAGILGLPYVYPEAGLLGGFILQFIFAVLSVYTLIIVIKAAQKLKVHDYEELGYKCFGNTGYIVVVTCLLLQDFGSMLNYLIIIGDSSSKIGSIWGYDTVQNRQLILLGVAILIIFPPCLLRDIAFYEKFSFVKLITIVLVISVIIYEYISYRIFEAQSFGVTAHKYTPPWSDITMFNLSGFPQAVGIVAYTFQVHDSAFLYYNTLWNPTVSRWTQLSTFGVTSAMMLGLLLSVPAYLIFGDHITSNMLNAFDITHIAVILIRIIYAATMALSYPTAFFVVRHVLYMSYQKIVYYIKEGRRKRIMDQSVYNSNDVQSEYRMRKTFEESAYTVKTSPLLHHGIITILLFVSNVTLALYITNLGIALSLVGSIASVNLIFILPALFYWKSTDFNYKFWEYKTWKQQRNAFVAVYGSVSLVVLGSFIGVIGICSVFV